MGSEYKKGSQGLQHMFTCLTMANEGTFECQICKKKLSSKKILSRHQKIHTGTHLHKCRYCSYQSRKDNVRQHERRIHGAGQNQVAKQSNTIATQTQHEPNTEPHASSEQQMPDTSRDAVGEEESASNDTPNEESRPVPQDVVENETQDADPQLNDDAVWNAKDHFKMRKIKDFFSKKWKTNMADYELLINDLPANGWQEKLLLILQHALENIQSNCTETSIGRVVLFIDGIQHPIHERVGCIRDLNLEQLLERIASVLNSNQSADISKGIKIHVIHTELPRGGTGATNAGRPGAYARRTILDPTSWAHRKRSLLNPAGRAPDNLCLSRCLVVAQALVDCNSILDVSGCPINFKLLYNWRCSIQKTKALELHAKAKVNVGPQCGIPQLIKFQTYLKDFQIILYEESSTEPSYRGPEFKRKQIYLFLQSNHYYIINSRKLCGFFAVSHFCIRCLTAWSHNRQHVCGAAACVICANPECENTSKTREERICEDCDRSFFTPGCFVAHQRKECHKFAICVNCKTVQKREELDPPGFKPSVMEAEDQSLHHCLANYCPYCKNYYMPGHHAICFVQKPKKAHQEEDEMSEDPIYELYGEKNLDDGYPDGDASDGDGECHEGRGQKQSALDKYYYADFETECHNNVHEPILMCMEGDDGKKFAYKGSSCAKDFVEDCFRKRKLDDETDENGPKRKKQRKEEDIGYKNCTIIYHNFGGFDSYPILKELLRLKIKPNVIFRGSRMLTMSIPQRKIRFVDSYLHCVMGLAQMPSAYGFANEQSKGHYPYKWATPSKRCYKGPLPPLEAYDGDNMTTKQRNKLIQWYQTEKKTYEENPNKIFDMQEENLKYCSSDVSILRQGIEIYRERMKEMFQGEDALHQITLPSACNYNYRKLMMEPKTIAIIPPHGYGRVTQSYKALAWLLWQSYSLGLPMYHSRNSNEIRVGNYKCDGLAFTQSKGVVIFEFHGCYYHGHNCIRNRTKMVHGKSMDECAENTREKEVFLQQAGYQVVSAYECQVEEQMKHNREMSLYISRMWLKLRRTEPLDPRQSLRGGRTNSLRKFYEPKPLEKLHYYDVNSLYPSTMACMNGEMYPIGAPTILLDFFPPIQEIFGLIKCTLRPPDRLYHPVLGILANNKLIYGLCQTCIQDGATTYCEHSDSERFISGTFVSEEVKLALKKSYTLISIDEVWQWWPEQRSDSLFKKFILTCYGQKIQASGWPSDIQSLIDEHGKDHPLVETKITQYIDGIQEQLGITIDRDKVEFNPALRSASKLVLNNFWIRFWAKDNSPEQTSFVEKIEEFYRLLTTKNVSSYFPVNEEMMLITWKERQELERADGKTNVVLGSFTTAMARLRLYSFLDIVGDRACYLDTDSVIWIERPNEPKIECGPMLGMMEDEIRSEFGPHAVISAYAGAGPKSYSLVISDPRDGKVLDYKRKLKGIKASYKVDQLLPAAKLIELVKKDYSENGYQVHVPQRNLQRNKKDTSLRWREMQKVVRCTFQKRLPPATLDGPSDPIGSRAP